MKQPIYWLLLVIVVFVFTTISADETVVITLTPENVESATQNTESITSDPFVNEVITNGITTDNEQVEEEQEEKTEKSKDEENEEEETKQKRKLSGSIGAEVTVVGQTKALTVPLKFNYGKVGFGLDIPYIYKKEMQYLTESRESSGIGDISMNFNYRSNFKSYILGFQFFSKFPTGDDMNMVDGYLVPLGTGSSDIVIGGKLNKSFENSFFTSNLVYKINGKSEKIAEIDFSNMDPDGNPSTTDIETIEYDIKNGNMFSGILSYVYFHNKFTYGSAISYTQTGEGSTNIVYTHSWDSNMQEENECAKQSL